MSAPSFKVVIVGCGGHGKVVLELLRSSALFHVVGWTDRGAAGRLVLGIPVLGDDSVLPGLLQDGVTHAFVAVGDNALRFRLGNEVRALGFRLANAVGARAAVSPSAQLGEGVAVMEGAVVNADAEIGDLSIVNTNSSVDHDCRVGKAVHVAPGATLTGAVTVGDRAFVGTGARVLPGLTLGADCVIGAGAVVTRDVPAQIVSYGVPARPAPSRPS